VAQPSLRPAAREGPFYLPRGNEAAIFEQCHARGLPVLLKGPTGCGKTRFLEYMAWRLERPLITVACHDDLSATDLTGRYLVLDGETVWHDGPLSAAARAGAICYLDELVEARADTIVVIHPLADHRRVLPIEKTGELIEAADGFQLVISYNPGYQQLLKELKPSTRQRFVTIEFALPAPDTERRIVAHEGGVPDSTAAALVELAGRIRRLDAHGLAELPSPRLLVSTARLMTGGIAAREACRAALIAPLTDDPELLSAMDALVTATF
jgi:nitric oxide reductase NorQ protein